MKVPKKDKGSPTILSSVNNLHAFNRAASDGAEFRIMVRADTEVRPGKEKYSAAIAMAGKLRRPRSYPSGFAFALRVRPKMTIEPPQA